MGLITALPGFIGKSVDQFNLGIKEQLIFPEIDYDKIDKVRGMSIAITTSANTDAECLQLLREMGMPFIKEE